MITQSKVPSKLSRVRPNENLKLPSGNKRLGIASSSASSFSESTENVVQRQDVTRKPTVVRRVQKTTTSITQTKTLPCSSYSKKATGLSKKIDTKKENHIIKKDLISQRNKVCPQRKNVNSKDNIRDEDINMFDSFFSKILDSWNTELCHLEADLCAFDKLNKEIDENEKFLSERLVSLKSLERQHITQVKSLISQKETFKEEQKTLQSDRSVLTRDLLQFDSKYDSILAKMESHRKFLEQIDANYDVASTVFPFLQKQICDTVSRIKEKESSLLEEFSILNMLQARCQTQVRDIYWICRCVRKDAHKHAHISLNLSPFEKTLDNNEALQNDDITKKGEIDDHLAAASENEKDSSRALPQIKIFYSDLNNMSTLPVQDKSINLATSNTPFSWIEILKPKSITKNTENPCEATSIFVPFDSLIVQDSTLKPHKLMITDWKNVNLPKNNEENDDEKQIGNPNISVLDSFEQSQVNSMCKSLLEEIFQTKDFDAFGYLSKVEPSNAVIISMGINNNNASKTTFWGSKRASHVTWTSAYDSSNENKQRTSSSCTKTFAETVNETRDDSDQVPELQGVLFTALEHIFHARDEWNKDSELNCIDKRWKVEICVQAAYPTNNITSDNNNCIELHKFSVESDKTRVRRSVSTTFPSCFRQPPTLLTSPTSLDDLSEMLDSISTSCTKKLIGVTETDKNDFFMLGQQFYDPLDNSETDFYKNKQFIPTLSLNYQDSLLSAAAVDDSSATDEFKPSPKRLQNPIFTAYDNINAAMEGIYKLKAGMEGEAPTKCFHMAVFVRLSVANKKKLNSTNTTDTTEPSLNILLLDVSIGDAPQITDVNVIEVLKEISMFPSEKNKAQCSSSSALSFKKKGFSTEENVSRPATLNSPMGQALHYINRLVETSLLFPSVCSKFPGISRKGGCLSCILHVDMFSVTQSDYHLFTKIKSLMVNRSSKSRNESLLSSSPVPLTQRLRKE